MSSPSPEFAKKLIDRHAAMKAERAPWDAFWQEVGNYVMPRKAEILDTTSSPSTAKQQVLFDSTAIRSNNILANGQLAWMTPHESSWFSFDPPPELAGNEAVAQWFKRCTEIAHLEFSRCNFYSEIHELYLDRGAFGTAAIFCDEGKRNALRFETWNVGTFSIAEDDEGYVDTASREYPFSVRQAAQHFGEENLSEAMRKTLAEKDPKKLDEKHTFIHLIYPRDPAEIDPTKADPQNMPIASIHIDMKAKHVVKESGFRELPFFVTRFLKWGKSAYGWSPSWIALPEARQVNFLEMNMDALAEIAAFPRMLIPNNYVGDIDTRAGGVTYFDPSNPNAIPKEWATAGRYDIGSERADRKRKAIEDAFHVDLFQMFSQLQKNNMTATEVSERSAEKLIQFSPTFARMTTELFNPLVRRAFSILLRGGYFPPVPPEAIVQDAAGSAFLPEPKISYSSRIAMSIRALENNAFNRSLAMIMPVAQLRPDILDNFDFDKIIRTTSRNDGMPADWIADAETVKQIRQARAEAQAKQAQMEQAQMMADAAGKAGNIKPESAVGQALSQAM